MPACAVCTSPKRAEMEVFGKKGLLGEVSWRQCALLAGANNPKSLQNHMQTHYDAKAVEGSEKDWMADAKAELERLKEVERALADKEFLHGKVHHIE